MRNLARSTPPAAITPYLAEGIITEIREYTLITPLFGGGVKTFEYDPVTVVRASEVRGQLRFWWRACRGATSEKVTQSMKDRESAIWGKAYKKGEESIRTDKLVNIVVKNTSQNIKADYTDFPLYAGFPLQPTREERDKDPNVKKRPVYKNVSFQLTIRFPAELKHDIHAALWAWESFGGVGARTRRGFGALHLEKIDGKSNVDVPVSGDTNAVRIWLNNKLEEHVVAGTWLDGTPHLSVHPHVCFTKLFPNSMLA